MKNLHHSPGAGTRGQKSAGPHASMNSKREENRWRGGERANRWDQAGMAPSGSRLRMRVEGPETLLQTQVRERGSLCGMLGVMWGGSYWLKKHSSLAEGILEVQEKGSHQMTVCLQQVRLKQMERSSGRGRTASNWMYYCVMEGSRGMIWCGPNL